MIPAERAHLHVAAGTHAGMSGKNNEDRFAVTALRIDGEHPLPVVFAIVCDGIGGHRAGEVAAETAVETISQTVAQSDGTHPVETLYEAIQSAGQAVWAQAEEDANKSGMGATCACALIIDNRLFTASVGDSRIYLVRSGRIHQITIDHTWIQEALDAGVLTPEQARGHPNSHVIRRYLGSPQPVEPDMRLRLSPADTDEQMMANQGMQLEPCDQLILCSDGLTDLVSADEIQKALKNSEQQEAVEALIRLANERGGHDNITIVALQAPSTILETTPTLPVIRPGRARAFSWTACLTGILGLAALAAVLLVGYWFWSDQTAPASPTATATRQSSLTPTALTTQPAVTTRTATTTPPPTGSGTPTATVWVTLPSTLISTAQPSLTPWPTSTRAP